MRAIVTVDGDGLVKDVEYMSELEGPKKTIKLEENQYSIHSSKIPSKFFKSIKDFKIINGTLTYSPPKH